MLDRLNALKIIPLLFALTACAKEQPTQPAVKELSPKEAAYLKDFSSQHECSMVTDAPRQLVEAFIQVIMHAAATRGRPLSAQKRFLKRIAGQEDPFVVYRDFRDSGVDKDAGYGPADAAWAVMDRYERERPDWSKSGAKCKILPADNPGISHIVEQRINFAPLPTDQPDAVLYARIINSYRCGKTGEKRASVSFDVEEKWENGSTSTDLLRTAKLIP